MPRKFIPLGNEDSQENLRKNVIDDNSNATISIENSQVDIDSYPSGKFRKELEELIVAQYPLIYVRSSEETRCEKFIRETYLNLITDSPDRQIKEGKISRWSALNGFQEYSGAKNNPNLGEWHNINTSAPNPNEDPILHALNFLTKELDTATDNPNNQYIYLLSDWSALIKPDCELTARRLKELVLNLERKTPRPRMSLIIIGAEWSIPAILRNHVHILDLPLPIGKEMYQEIFQLAQKRYSVSEEDAKKLSEQAQGMPLQAATQTAKLITTRNFWLQPQEAGKLLLETKKQEIRKTGVLEFYAPTGVGLEGVGGLENIKTWINSRYPWFEQDLDPDSRPRAILLEGFPGCGKSFIARAIATQWGVPQINFEITRLQSKWVGESESNTYQALRAIEASAPNILFMDEIEKAFSGVGGDSSGTTTRQFGTFLTWLNDHQEPIFFIATSNDRNSLPPELFRAGRFDETFLVMPPTSKERGEILQKRAFARKLPAISAEILEFLVQNTAGFSGAELDKLVKETKILAGLNQNPSDDHWQIAHSKIVPQYRNPRMQELLRHYLVLIESGSIQPASIPEEDFWNNLIDR